MKFLVNDPDSTKDNKEETSAHEHEEIGKGTKLKVVAALLVVGFAVYVAWWVQEPTGVKADVLSETSQTETSDGNAAEMLAEATAESSSEELTQEVSISNFAFDPMELSVEKDTTVTWVNRDSVVHTITGDDFSSGTLDSGESYSFTFKQDGTYDYYCAFHPAESGTIIVGTGLNEMAATEVTEESGEILPEDILSDTQADTFTATGEAAEEDGAVLYVDDMVTTDDLDGDILEGATVSVTDDATASLDAAGGDVHASAAESDELASSGPEDILYLGAFMVILYLNRRRLAGSLR
jgi:plastocyanin